MSLGHQGRRDRALTIQKLLRIFWTQKLILITALVVVAAGAVLYQHRQTAVYQSSVGVALSSDLTSTDSQKGAAPVDFSPRAAVADPVVTDAAQKTGLDPEFLQRTTSAEIDPTSGNLTITATGTDPAMSQRAAEAVAAAYTRSLKASITSYADTLNDQLEELAKQIQSLQKQLPTANSGKSTDPLLQARIDSGVSRYTDLSAQIARINALGDPLTVVSPALPGSLTTPSAVVVIGIGLLAGLLAGIGLALVWNQANPRVRAPDDLPDGVDVPLLGTVPRFRPAADDATRIAVLDQPGSPFTEAVRGLRASIAAGLPDGRFMLVVASPGADEGRSFLSANLAASFAQSGRRTALVCGDVRDDGVLEYLGESAAKSDDNNQGGAGQGREDEAQSPLEATKVDDLYVVRQLVHCAPAADALAQDDTQKALIDIAGRVDVVVIDSPALADYADATVLGSYATGVVLLARRGRTRPAAVEAAIDRLRSAGAKPVGIVLNRVS